MLRAPYARNVPPCPLNLLSFSSLHPHHLAYCPLSPLPPTLQSSREQGPSPLLLMEVLNKVPCSLLVHPTCPSIWLSSLGLLPGTTKNGLGIGSPGMDTQELPRCPQWMLVALWSPSLWSKRGYVLLSEHTTNTMATHWPPNKLKDPKDLLRP